MNSIVEYDIDVKCKRDYYNIITTKYVKYDVDVIYIYIRLIIIILQKKYVEYDVDVCISKEKTYCEKTDVSECLPWGSKKEEERKYSRYIFCAHIYFTLFLLK